MNIGFIGLGIISATHLAVLAEFPNVQLAFTVDPTPPTDFTFKGQQPPHYASTQAALQAHKPDWVIIATPTSTHIDILCEVLQFSNAHVLLEKPAVHDIEALQRLLELDPSLNAHGRVAVAHHFAFSPEVIWTSDLIAAHPEWGPITQITSAFYDPYLSWVEKAYESYISSWTDSGPNQLSMLTRFVELQAIESLHEFADRTCSWCTVRFPSGIARLHTSWRTGWSSKRSTFNLGESGTEIWIDHTALTGVAMRGSEMLAVLANDDPTPRKVAHYRPLYHSLFSGNPDPVLSINTAAKVFGLMHGA